eukprot:gene8592-417_t
MFNSVVNDDLEPDTQCNNKNNFLTLTAQIRKNSLGLLTLRDKRKSEEETEEKIGREIVEKQAILNWINRILLPNGIKIENLCEDFSSGYNFCILAENLTTKKIKKKIDKPKNQTQKISNVSLGLETLKKENVHTYGCSPNDIVSCNEKILLSLLWKIIMKYHPNPSRLQEIIDANEPKKRDILLKWCHEICNEENINISDFKTNFSNGIGLCILMNLFDSSFFDIEKIKKESIEGNYQTHINLIKNAMIAGMKFEIECFIDASSIQDCSEEYLFVLYLNQIHQKIEKLKSKKELTSLERTRSFFKNLEKNNENKEKSESTSTPTTPRFQNSKKEKVNLLKEKQLQDDLSNEKSKHLITFNQLEVSKKKLNELSKKVEENENEIERLKIENEKNSEILIERLDVLQKENKNQIEKAELEMIEKDVMIKKLIEEKSKLEEQNELLKSHHSNESKEFKEKYDSFISEQSLQSEIKNLNERIEQYTKGIMKVQNKHVREMERLSLENEYNLKNLTTSLEEKMKLKEDELNSKFDLEKNDLIEEFENKIKLMKQEYETDINIIKSQRDSMQMTLEEYKINNGSIDLNKNKKTPMVLSSKAKTLLMGDDDQKSN